MAPLFCKSNISLHDDAMNDMHTRCIDRGFGREESLPGHKRFHEASTQCNGSCADVWSVNVSGTIFLWINLSNK